jgi:hypothetical protein
MVEASQPNASKASVVKKIPRITTPQSEKDTERKRGESVSASERADVTVRITVNATAAPD